MFCEPPAGMSQSLPLPHLPTTTMTTRPGDQLRTRWPWQATDQVWAWVCPNAEYDLSATEEEQLRASLSPLRHLPGVCLPVDWPVGETLQKHRFGGGRQTDQELPIPCSVCQPHSSRRALRKSTAHLLTKENWHS